MLAPKPLRAFKNLLLRSKDIINLVTECYGSDAENRMKWFNAGQIDDLLDLIEDNKFQISGSPEHTIDGAAPDEDIFKIEIWKVGPVYCIRASEFDDIGYFSSRGDASCCDVCSVVSVCAAGAGAGV